MRPELVFSYGLIGIGLLGNALVFFILVKHTRLKKPTNIYLFNLGKAHVNLVVLLYMQNKKETLVLLWGNLRAGLRSVYYTDRAVSAGSEKQYLFQNF